MRKPNLLARAALCAAIFFPTLSTFAATLYWDGGSSNLSGNGTGVSLGGAGTWNTTIQNWDQGSGLPYTAWSNAGNYDAYFAGQTNIVTLGAAITANGLSFATTNGYVIYDGGNSANTLALNSTTNNTGSASVAGVTLNAGLVNSSTFTVNGTGSLILLQASPNLTGTLSVNAGLLQLGDGSANNGPVSFSGVTLNATNALVEFRNTVNTTIGVNITGVGGVEIQNKSGITTTLVGSNTYTNSTVIASGILTVDTLDDVNPSGLGTGPLQVGNNASSATFYYGGGPVTTTRPLLLGGNGASIISANGGALTLAGPFGYGPNQTTAKVLELVGTSAASQPNVLACALTNHGTVPLTLNKQGACTWIIEATNAYSGGTTFVGSSGTLLITNDVALGVATNWISFTNSGTLGSFSNSVTLGASRTVIVYTNGTANFSTPDTNNFTIASFITGAGKVNRGASSYLLGTVRFSNDTNNYTGDFSFGFGNTEFTSVGNQGTPSSLGAGSAATGGAITAVNSTSYGILRYVGTNLSTTLRPVVWTATSGSLQLDNTNTGTIQYLSTTSLVAGVGSKTLFLNASGMVSNTLNEVIADDGGVTSLSKIGVGEWILGGTNIYSGATTVNSGLLLVNGSLGVSSAVTVASGGTLGGTGVIGGAVTVTNGGTLAAGNPNSASVATLAIDNVVTNLGTISMKLNKAGGNSDQLTGISTLVYGGTLALTNLAGALAVNDSFQLFKATNYQGSFSAIVPATPGSGLAWDTSSLASNGTIKIMVGAATTAPAISSISLSGSNLILSGTNGTANGTFYLLMSTNLGSTNWTYVSTNTYDATGSFSLTNAVTPGLPAAFFRLAQ